LLLKLTLVLVILGVAAMNKLMLVPVLISSGSIVKLQRSIRYELAIAVVILVATSYLSTIVGPAEHQM
jgi:putative copper resistance protein D